jgi:hypothetical protein
MTDYKHTNGKPLAIYVATSWKNPYIIALKAGLESAARMPEQPDFTVYDFRATGFRWKELGVSDQTDLDLFKTGLESETAISQYHADLEAIDMADTLIMILPCGKSAHIELGMAIAKKKNTAIWFTEYIVEPDLMYLEVDFLTDNFMDLIGWCGVVD